MAQHQRRRGRPLGCTGSVVAPDDRQRSSTERPRPGPVTLVGSTLAGPVLVTGPGAGEVDSDEGGGHGEEMAELPDVLERARTLGVLGPGPVDTHIEHADAFVQAVADRRGPVLDLGSGGGVPGLVLACARPDLELALLDAQERRTALLREAVEALGFTDRVTVLHGRAEDLARDPGLRAAFDVVTARSFGPPAVVAECAAPFLRVGGRLVVSEPPESDGSRWPAPALAALGLTPAPTSPAGFQALVQDTPCPEAYPRRSGVPGKRPLFRD